MMGKLTSTFGPLVLPRPQAPFHPSSLHPSGTWAASTAQAAKRAMSSSSLLLLPLPLPSGMLRAGT